MKGGVTVSVILPTRNEGREIAACLDSIVANDYPKDLIEVLVADGMSEDGTRAIVQEFVDHYSFIRLLDNPKKIASTALNIGIKNARGSIIMRMDAHNAYPPNYISGLITWLERSGADNVGGLCITRPGNDTPLARAIAIGLSHPFGVGNSYFRIGVSEPRWVDTVPFGCYRREIFDRIGMFDEDLVRNQDDEFNLRLIKRGGRILLVPNIISYYHARGSLAKLWRLYYQYGYFKPLVVRKVGGVLTVRQVIPATFILGLLVAGMLAPWYSSVSTALGVVVLSYVATVVGCSAFVMFKRRLRAALLLPIVFPVLHVSYGLGFLKGMLNFLVLRRVPEAARIPITR